MIEFENVSKVYGKDQIAVDKLNLTIDQGELVVLIGPSGCGKTTTLKMINRIIEPSSGRILIRGEDIRDKDPVELRRGIGYVIQQIGLFPNLTIGENVTIVGKLLGWKKEKSRARAEELLELVDMDPAIYMERFPRELSGGQQQRIGVLRALAAEPELILMDEPFGALDPITRNQLQAELKNLQSQLNKTIVFVTHDMDEALSLADRIVLMRDGKPVQVASPDEMLRNPADDFVLNFIGEERLLRSPDEVLVDNVMITDPVTIARNKGWAEALERMRSQRVDSLMVVGRGLQFMGIITAKDVQAHLQHDGTIEEHLQDEYILINTGETVRQAVHLMAEHKVGSLPVTDSKGRLRGLITRASLVNILSNVMWPSANNGNNGAATDLSERGDRIDATAV